MPGNTTSRPNNRFYGRGGGFVKRTQRHPQYLDDDLRPFFAEVSAGYCFKQAAQRACMDWKTLNNTLDSDDESLVHALNLSMVAGAKIRAGLMNVPDRHDGLYDEYRT